MLNLRLNSVSSLTSSATSSQRSCHLRLKRKKQNRRSRPRRTYGRPKAKTENLLVARRVRTRIKSNKYRKVKRRTVPSFLSLRTNPRFLTTYDAVRQPFVVPHEFRVGDSGNHLLRNKEYITKKLDEVFESRLSQVEKEILATDTAKAKENGKVFVLAKPASNGHLFTDWTLKLEDKVQYSEDVNFMTPKKKRVEHLQEIKNQIFNETKRQLLGMRKRMRNVARNKYENGILNVDANLPTVKKTLKDGFDLEKRRANRRRLRKDFLKKKYKSNLQVKEHSLVGVCPQARSQFKRSQYFNKMVSGDAVKNLLMFNYPAGKTLRAKRKIPIPGASDYNIASPTLRPLCFTQSARF